MLKDMKYGYYEEYPYYDNGGNRKDWDDRLNQKHGKDNLYSNVFDSFDNDDNDDGYGGYGGSVYGLPI